MVLNVKALFKLQGDEESFLQLDAIQAVGALGIGVGEIWAVDHTVPLGEEVVTAFHCNKHKAGGVRNSGYVMAG